MKDLNMKWKTNLRKKEVIPHLGQSKGFSDFLPKL
jgi:hypothetical protein